MGSSFQTFEGLKRTAHACIELAHYAAQKLTSINGITILNDQPFANEFTIRLPVSAYAIIDKLVPQGYVPGFPLGRYYQGMENCLLIACTEKRTKQDIGILVELMRGALE